jgi:hypothetical protein
MEIFTTLFGLLKGIVESVRNVADWRSKRAAERAALARRKDAKDLLRRFLSLFELYEVPRPLIPKFLGAQHLLTIEQACSDELLQGAITDALLEHTAKRLSIPSSWLYGTASGRYTRHWNYKNPTRLLDLLEELISASPGKGHDAELRVISNRSIGETVARDARLAILLWQTIDQVEGRDVPWVHVVENDLPWHHEPARLHAKQAVLIAMALGIPVRGSIADNKIFALLESGEAFPYELANSHGGMWHPDDYVLLREESQVAKETNEAVVIRNTLKACGILERADNVRRSLGRQDLYEVGARTVAIAAT